MFRRAGMAHTGYYSSRVPDAALGYTRTRPEGATGAPPARGWYPAWEVSSRESDDFIVGAPLGGGVSTADDLVAFAEAVTQHRLLSRDMTERVLTGHITADYDGRDGYGFETRLVNGVRSAGHRGGFPGIANHLEFYPDLGYVLVVLGNTDADGTRRIADYVRSELAAPRQ